MITPVPRLLPAETVALVATTVVAVVSVAEIAMASVADAVSAVEAVVSVVEIAMASAVAVAAVESAVAVVVVPEPDSPLRRDPLRSTELRLVAVEAATDSRVRPVRMPTPWTERTVPARPTVETARVATLAEAGKAKTMPPRTRRPRVPPSRRRSVSASPDPSPLRRKKRKKLATLLTTSWLTSRPSQPDFLPPSRT